MSQEKKSFSDIVHSSSQFIEKYIKEILAIFVVIIFATSGLVFKKNYDRGNEEEAFSELYAVTQVYDEKKADFNTAKEEAEKAKQPPAKLGDKADPVVPEKKKNLKAATGDLTQDYGDIVTKLEDFISKNPQRNASGEAALILSEIYTEYKMYDKGAEALTKTLKEWKNKNILYYVMELRAGDLFASANQCEKAVPHWQAVADSKSFVADQAQLKLGVCLQQVGRIDEAKIWFEKIKTASPNSTEGFNAKRYLRYLEFKSKTPSDSSSENKAQQKEASSKETPS